VHLTKGCYRGQETVAKVHNLGHPPRRLVALQLDGSDSVLPVRGAAVRVGDAVVGAVTSAALHYEDGPIALAVVRRSVSVDAEFAVDTDAGPVSAAQEVIVPPEAGATANVPRLTRLSRRASAAQ
jgi:folate-binding Fe-S cluster repair protein YgfZ